uniref:Proteoglycan 4a n=1 Tax=Paramormyrops kingsleyae TaxID=1676925 RepID=A0A3B3T6B3_9TELE
MYLLYFSENELISIFLILIQAVDLQDQATCRGRCGEPFSRGRVCHCDYSCLFHNECCEDFESTCTTSGSCVGRCGEPFKRGQQCDCDPNCVLYNQCCPDFQTQCNADDANETDLCNGQPINGVTVLLNGTMVVFRGHLFWTLDVNFTPSPARRITEVWGVPSPIDAVFTRSNCQGQTYIIKGNNYWRFENGVMDPGYPKTLSVEFNGLSGKITAALSVPATRRRPESIYFFKKGYIFQFACTSHHYRGKHSLNARLVLSCRGPLHYNRGNCLLPTEIGLGNEINIKLTWKGFPSPVTTAVSTPNPRKSEGYDYCIFSNERIWVQVTSLSVHSSTGQSAKKLSAECTAA